MEKSNAERGVKTYIDIKSDWGFKKIFGTDENKQNLINFLNAFFAEEGIDQISDLTFTNKERQGDSPDERTILFDVICETEKGDRFIVEMQKYRQPDLVDRIISYLELKKFPQSAGELNNMLEKWVYLFNNLTVMNGRPEVLDDECFDSVLSAAEYAALSEMDRKKYDEAIMTELDYQGALEYAKQHGFEEGREEGREEGVLQQRLKVLKNMLDRRMDDESIKAVLDIDEDLLLKLKSQL